MSHRPSCARRSAAARRGRSQPPSSLTRGLCARSSAWLSISGPRGGRPGPGWRPAGWGKRPGWGRAGFSPSSATPGRRAGLPATSRWSATPTSPWPPASPCSTCDPRRGPEARRRWEPGVSPARPMPGTSSGTPTFSCSRFSPPWIRARRVPFSPTASGACRPLAPERCRRDAKALAFLGSRLVTAAT